MGQTIPQPPIVNTILDGCSFLSNCFQNVDLSKLFLECGQQCNALSIFVKEANKHFSEFSPDLKKMYQSVNVKLYNECISLTRLNTEFHTTLKLMEKELAYYRNVAKTDENAISFTLKMTSFETTFRKMAEKFELYHGTLGKMGEECVEVAQQIDNEIPKQKFGKARAWSIVGIVTGCIFTVGGAVSIILGVVVCFLAPALAPALIGGGIGAFTMGLATLIPCGKKLSNINDLENGTKKVASGITETAKCLTDIIAQCNYLANNSGIAAESKWTALGATIDTLMILIKSSRESSAKLDDSITKLVASVLK